MNRKKNDQSQTMADNGSAFDRMMKVKVDHQNRLDRIGVGNILLELQEHIQRLEDVMVAQHECSEQLLDDMFFSEHKLEVLREQGKITTEDIEEAARIARFNVKRGMKIFDYSWYNKSETDGETK